MQGVAAVPASPSSTVAPVCRVCETRGGRDRWKFTAQVGQTLGEGVLNRGLGIHGVVGWQDCGFEMCHLLTFGADGFACYETCLLDRIGGCLQRGFRVSR